MPPSLLAFLSLALVGLAAAESSVLAWRYDVVRKGGGGCNATSPCWVRHVLTRRVRLSSYPYTALASGVAWDYGDGSSGASTLSLATRDELAGWEEWRGEEAHA